MDVTNTFSEREDSAASKIVLLSHFLFLDGAEYQLALLERDFTSAVIWASFFSSIPAARSSLSLAIRASRSFHLIKGDGGCEPTCAASLI